MEPSLEAINVSYKRLFEQGYFGFSKDNPLLLDSVLALEHVVDLGKVVSTRGDGRGVTLGSVVLLEMGLLSEIAHLSKTVSKRFLCMKLKNFVFTSS
jgi:hypothetical protein